MALALNAILMFLRHLQLIFTNNNNNKALGGKQNRVEMSRGKNFEFAFVVKVFFFCCQCRFFMPWTVENFLATFYKCFDCQLTRSLSLPLPLETYFPSLSLPLSPCCGLFWHLPQWPRSGLTLAAASFSLCTVPCDEPFWRGGNTRN